MKSFIDELDQIEAEIGKFNHYKDGNTSRAFIMLVRAKYQSFIRLNAISDHKAHIMVNVTSLFIGAIFILLQVDSILDRFEYYIIFLFLVFVLISLIFSVLSVRPFTEKQLGAERPGLAAALTFHQLDLLEKEAFKDAFDATMKSQTLIFDNVAEDFYMLGRVLRIKYRHIRRSYDFFFTGLILATALLLIEFLYSQFYL